MLNTIAICGRVTKDPELRYTQSQTPVATFTLAVDRDFVDKSGHRLVDFIDCVAWRDTGTFAMKYFKKGSMVMVNGRLQIRDWIDKNGNRRRNAEVVVENIYFGESKRRVHEESAEEKTVNSDATMAVTWATSETEGANNG